MRWFRSNKNDVTAGSPGAKLKLPQIVARNVKSVGTLDGKHFVFLLTMNTGDQLVLKAEMEIGSSAMSKSHDIGVRIMGLVSPVRAETLSPQELAQIDLLSDGITIDFFRAEKAIQAGRAKWVKAAFQQGLVGIASEKDFREVQIINRARVDVIDENKKAQLKGKMAKLQIQLQGNVKAWKSLGRIAAVDMVLGNTDRLDIPNGGVTNWGNIIFRETKGKISEAVGLDTLDAGQVGMSNLVNGDFEEWKSMFADYLKKPELARPKMREIINDCNRQINRDFGEQGSWGDKEANALYEGFAAGVKDLKTKMNKFGKQMLASKSGAPSGLVRRLHHIGWLG